MAAALHSGTVRGTMTVARQPRSCAASASAPPWLPELQRSEPGQVTAAELRRERERAAVVARVATL